MNDVIKFWTDSDEPEVDVAIGKVVRVIGKIKGMWQEAHVRVLRALPPKNPKRSGLPFYEGEIISLDGP